MNGKTYGNGGFTFHIKLFSFLSVKKNVGEMKTKNFLNFRRDLLTKALYIAEKICNFFANL